MQINPRHIGEISIDYLQHLSFPYREILHFLVFDTDEPVTRSSP